MWYEGNVAERESPQGGAASQGARDRFDLETWLRSPARRWALILLVIVLASASMTIQLREIEGFRGGRGFRGPRPSDVPWLVLFARLLGYWALWAVVGALCVRMARTLLAQLRSWVLFALVQIPFSAGVALCFVGVRVLLLGVRPGRPVDWEDLGLVVSRTWHFQIWREWIVYWLVLAVGTSVHAFLLRREEERRSAALELASESLRGQLAAARLRSLEAQLHPHFLFNALHTVGSLVRAEERDLALRTLSAIGDLLRATLELGERQTIPMREELALARRFLAIEQTRFKDRLETKITADESLLDVQVPALVLLPLLENAVRHGVAPRGEGGRVELRVTRSEGEIVIEVADDGPGWPEHGSPETGGIGLANTRQRLQALYGKRGTLELKRAPGGGALVRVRLPIEGGLGS